MPALRVGILHPDLGIGGAERLIVDAAIGLQKLGHYVEIFTSHHDAGHCFEETKDGSLSVHHIPSPFPRALFGRFHIVFAILSQLHLTIMLLLAARNRSIPVCDVYMVDQLSACLPLLRWGLGRRVVFYCHFPDKLLAGGKVAPPNGVRQESFIRRLYRLPADWLEEKTTKQADAILANSKFTVRVFKNAFPTIATVPQVVYPGINVSAYEGAGFDASELGGIEGILNYPALLSLNRFEGKKNLGLAIRAYAKFKASLSEGEGGSLKESLRLILGGGYDPRLKDNVDTLSALRDLCASLNITYHVYPPLSIPDNSEVHVPPFPDLVPGVTFLLNFTTPQRSAFLNSKNTLALLYTPEHEHFGIGPVEAMVTRVPVLACESGGPTESINNVTTTSSNAEHPTGYLLPSTPEAFAKALRHLLFTMPPSTPLSNSTAALTPVTLFSMDAMAHSLSSVLESTTAISGKISLIKNTPDADVVGYGLWIIRGLCALAFVSVYMGWL
ncbi:mannosyltransferase [Cantharellus anzutake]|uniref:mannosyltransferase n=1 Tax=Cantharellus anzutake TaxID=1750568 RepID=UPI001903BD07|nr:mannosyltransferase [Cantharellus anzutake]KAF8328830.1 mannosyltransferase [Cantharellus anzutake]